MPDEVEGKLIGKVIHYFDKIQVAVVALTAPLKVEVEHEKIDKAKKGDEVGMKVSGKVRDGYRVYKV